MYWNILNELLHKDCLQQLKKFKQHRFTTTYEHCRHVAVTSYQLAEKWHITVNEKALAVACMFHDYYLYDIKDEHLGPWHHGTRHASIAIRNAEKVYPLNNLEKEIIRSHMWPLNITQIPASREAWLVCLPIKSAQWKRCSRFWQLKSRTCQIAAILNILSQTQLSLSLTTLAAIRRLCSSMAA